MEGSILLTVRSEEAKNLNLVADDDDDIRFENFYNLGYFPVSWNLAVLWESETRLIILMYACVEITNIWCRIGQDESCTVQNII